MSRQMTISWPAKSTTAFSAIVSGGAGLFPGTFPIVLPNIQRKFSFTSGDNDSAVNFTFVGTDARGVAVTEVLAGANAGTVQTVSAYQSVTSITASAPYTNMSLGSGDVGRTQWIQLDNYLELGNVSVQVNVLAGTINYSVVQTLDQLWSLNQYGTMTMASPMESAFNAALTAKAVDATVIGVPAPNALALLVNSSTDGALTLTVMQQGI